MNDNTIIVNDRRHHGATTLRASVHTPRYNVRAVDFVKSLRFVWTEDDVELLTAREDAELGRGTYYADPDDFIASLEEQIEE